MEEDCVAANCDLKASKMMLMNSEERRKVNYAGRERWVFLCPDDYDLCVDILGYDPMFKDDETALGAVPVI